MQSNTVPEIQRVSVAQVVLQLKVLGVKSPMDFPYISPPSIAALKKALEMLYLLGALNPVCFTLSMYLLRLILPPSEALFSYQSLFFLHITIHPLHFFRIIIFLLPVFILPSSSSHLL
jgi:hypothetical protein